VNWQDGRGSPSQRSLIELQAEARAFAKETSDLLNATVTNGIRIGAAVHPTRGMLLGLGLGKNNLVADPIPLAQHAASARLFLSLVHTMVLDQEEQFLTAFSTTYSVQIGDADDADVLCSYDYVRNPPNKYPAAHMHVYSTSDETKDLFETLNTPKRKMADLHLPVGGKRFRPCLEDILEFLILDELVEPRDGWEEAIEAGRELWFQRQLGAAVRRNPQLAQDQLNELDPS